jgi:hypothetical protein
MNAGIDPKTCCSFDLVACGPILPAATTMEDHRPRRDKVAAMEKALHDVLHNAGYTVLNEVHSRQRVDDPLWQDVLAAFAERFPKLRA